MPLFVFRCAVGGPAPGIARAEAPISSALFYFTAYVQGFNWKITVIVVSTSTGSPFNMVGR